jgi:Ca2+-binding EF-hand superfamily protein
MEKARVAAEARRGEPRAGAETATRAASPGLEEETRDVVLVSRNFDQAARTSAFDKLRGAAKLYNKNHPSAFSLESFSCSCMAILEFKELVRRIFSLNFNEYELGAILEEFESSECSNSVDCSRFLVHFTRAGSLAREQELREARAKSRQAKQMEDQKKMALKEEQKMVTQEVLATAVTEVDRAAMQNKLIAAAKSYDKNHPSAMGLGAFEVASIAIPEFWYLIRLTFNLSLNRAEFHALIQYLGTDANGQIRCNDFLVKFLKIGREAKDNDRRQVIKENQTAVSSGVKTLQTEMQMSAVVDPSEYETCREEDFSSAWNKLRHSVYLHAKNETSLLGANSFDKKYVTLSELKRITKYVFKCSLSHDELLGLVKNYDDDRLGVLCSQSFLRDLRKANFEVRERIRAEEIKAKEVSSPNLKSDLSVDSLASDATFTTTDFDESDFSSAFGKLTHAAANYDRYHPSSVGLDGFESKYLLYSEFAELLRRTFNLRLNAREMSALLRHFDPDCRNSIISSDFIRVFFKIGIEERSRCHHEALKKRRESTVISAREVERSHTAAAYGRCYVDYAFEKADEDSAFKKFHDAAFKFDKSHPASFSLNSFEVSAMRVTEFRDMISRALGLRFTPKEFGALLVHFNASEDELINPQKFISEFLRTGISLRHKFNSDLLVAKRDLLKQREQDADMKHRARIENREDDVDWNFSPGDSESAFTKLKQAAFVFDKNMPSAPSLNGFSCKYLEARVFREMARLVFNLKLTPKEVAAIVKHYDVSGKNVLDCASFLTDFLRNGVHLRALEEEAQRKKKREHDRVIELQKSKKLEDSANRADFTPDFKFSEMDVVSAEQKLLDAAVKFDKSASSGSVGLSAFDSQKLSYGNFREVLKLCFGLKLNNRELTSLAVKFDPESSGSVNSTQFLHFFLKLGIDERSRLRNAQLAQNREKLLLLRAEEDEKLKIASKVNEIEIDFDVSNEIKDRAFEKLTAAAARYDPYHPASIPATAFDCKVMGPATFRDMARRTFNLNLSTKELGAIFTNFGASASNPSIRCQEFMVYFIKTGFNEREKCRAVSLRLQKEHELFEKKSREEILMQQEILNELKVDWDFDENDAKNAVKKFIAAAKDYDPNHPSAVGLDAFSQKQMSVEVFREMMKRILGLRLSPRELGALVDYFDKEKNKMVDCGDFLTKLVVLGSNERDKIRSLQRAQEMASFERSKREEEERRKDVENRSDIAVDYEFNVADLKVALEKLEKGIGSYDKYHPAAVPLTSFEASTLSPGQFREQLKLIFGAVLGAKELGALVIHFKTDGDDRIVDCAKFLHHYSAVRRNLKAEEAESKRLARLEIQERRDKIRKEMESRHEDEMKSILLHSSDDERRLTSTLRHCARKFVIDSASFVEYLQASA